MRPRGASSRSSPAPARAAIIPTMPAPAALTEALLGARARAADDVLAGMTDVPRHLLDDRLAFVAAIRRS